MFCAYVAIELVNHECSERGIFKEARNFSEQPPRQPTALALASSFVPEPAATPHDQDLTSSNRLVILLFRLLTGGAMFVSLLFVF